MVLHLNVQVQCKYVKITYSRLIHSVVSCLRLYLLLIPIVLLYTGHVIKLLT